MKIAVGSTNPVKVAAVREVLRRVYPQMEMVGLEVDSGVSAQPWGEGAAREGAIRRARRALEGGKAELGVGIEGGVVETEWGLMTCAWCAIVDAAGRMGLGGGVHLLLPPSVRPLLEKGAELGEAMDALTGMEDTKRKMGAVGILTAGLSSRQEAYEHIVKLALARFLAPHYYGRVERAARAKGPWLVSACLVGIPCRYDGSSTPLRPLQEMAERGQVIPFCPEVAGGLPVPRKRAEIRGGDGRDVLEGRARVVNEEGDDVTACFLEGAHRALQLARRLEVERAVLKSLSPSCGSGLIYDGTFSGRLREGDGVTTALLKRAGIPVQEENHGQP